MYESTNGIGLLVVKNLTQVPSSKDGRGLILQLDDNERPVRLYYYDVLGEVELDPSNFNMESLDFLAEEKEVNLFSSDPCLLYLSPQEINSTLPTQASRIRTEQEIVPEYLRLNPDANKLSRKLSGLKNSYVRDASDEVIELECKNECRVVWQDNPPSVGVFKNLPENTSAAYVLAYSRTDQTYKAYYIKNQEGAQPTMVATIKDTKAFEKFKLSHAAASKKELEDIEDAISHQHKNQATNVLGKGSFGRVKKSQSMRDKTAIATKTQDLPRQLAVTTKLDSRKAKILQLEDEARIAADVHGGSDKVTVIQDKAYMHMQQLGVPLNDIIPELDFDEKLDLTIKFLSAVADMHNGATRTGTRYAHRDIKPPNALYNRETGQVNLIDFGFSTSYTDEKIGANAGTLFYAPLNQSVINDYLEKRFSADSPVPRRESSKDSDESSAVQDFLDNSDSSDESVHDFMSGLDSEILDVNPDQSIHIAPGQNIAWQNKMSDPTYCLTANYIEDDKVASLRTVHCNPSPIKPGTVCSILTKDEFQRLPKPIRELFDTTTVAPLLTDERRCETLDFFAAIIIAYKTNPSLTDAEYAKMIDDLRQNPQQQQYLRTQYTQPNAVEEQSSKSDAQTEYEDYTSDEDSSLRLDSPLSLKATEKHTPRKYFSRKIQPIEDDALDRVPEPNVRDKPSTKSSFKKFTDMFKKNRVSPTTTDEISDSDENTDEQSTNQNTKPKP